MIHEQGVVTPGSDRQGAATPGSDRQGAGDPRALTGEDGSGTVNTLALIVLALALAVVLGGVGTAHREQARLQAVADLAALALEYQRLRVRRREPGQSGEKFSGNCQLRSMVPTGEVRTLIVIKPRATPTKGEPRKGTHRKTCTVLMGYSKGSASGPAPSSLCCWITCRGD